MAGSLNKVILIGNVGKDPEIRTTQDGREVASFSLATSEVWKDKSSGERRERTEWHRIIIFAPPLVNIVKNYIHKGSKLYLEGALQTRKWTDQNGNERVVTEIVLQNYNSIIMMLDGKNSSSSHDYDHHNEGDASHRAPANIQKPVAQTTNIAEVLDDEIPF
jgi:single-strand DNA-binding protein